MILWNPLKKSMFVTASFVKQDVFIETEHLGVYNHIRKYCLEIQKLK